MNDMSYFRAIQGTTGVSSEPEYKAEEAKRRLHSMFGSSINYCTALRNGVEQDFIITASEVKYKYEITAMPDEELNVGDMIQAYGEYFLVVQTRAVSPIQIVGQLWLCNYEMHWQNFGGEVLKQWCVFDSGQYSNTTSGDTTIMGIDATRRIYITSDADTDKIFVDKRLAVSTMYNQYGDEILECYQVVGRTKMAKTYGSQAHMITLTVETTFYNKDTDNIELMVCDYITDSSSSTEEDTQTSEKLKCSISGRSTISINGSRTYTGVFYDADGNAISITDPVWQYTGSGTMIALDDPAKCKVTIPNDEKLIGYVSTLTLSDSSGLYNPAIIEIEVV